MNKIIFLVDDNAVNLSTARDALKDKFKLMTMPSAAKMFELMTKIKPDLILLDIEMPEMNGFQALKLLKSNASQRDIPVIFLTGMNNAAVEVRGFKDGVIDFITKPFSPPVLLNRIQTHLNIDEKIRERTRSLEQRTQQLTNIKNGIVLVLADMVERRDTTTGGHVERTTSYVEQLVKKMIALGIYPDELSAMDLESLFSSARLHDVGKITVPDHILNKPGKLTDEEFEIIKTHTTEGERTIDQIVSKTGATEGFLINAKLFAGYHHERWDGKGYPYGLEGAAIPLQGRIMAIADVYDALISERPYKKAFTHEDAVRIIMDGAGTQFDPRIAEAFYAAGDQFKEIADVSKASL
ncbi:MAG: response regulator [Oscillospiraceae bacterium]|nr:response regulator [Oscillospiraceae bacterium]